MLSAAASSSGRRGSPFVQEAWSGGRTSMADDGCEELFKDFYWSGIEGSDVACRISISAEWHFAVFSSACRNYGKHGPVPSGSNHGPRSSKSHPTARFPGL